MLVYRHINYADMANTKGSSAHLPHDLGAADDIITPFCCAMRQACAARKCWPLPGFQL